MAASASGCLALTASTSTCAACWWLGKEGADASRRVGTKVSTPEARSLGHKECECSERSIFASKQTLEDALGKGSLELTLALLGDEGW